MWGWGSQDYSQVKGGSFGKSGKGVQGGKGGWWNGNYRNLPKGGGKGGGKGTSSTAQKGKGHATQEKEKERQAAMSEVGYVCGHCGTEHSFNRGRWWAQKRCRNKKCGAPYVGHIADAQEKTRVMKEWEKKAAEKAKEKAQNQRKLMAVEVWADICRCRSGLIFAGLG